MSRSVCVQGHLVYIHCHYDAARSSISSITPSLEQKFLFEWMLVATIDGAPILLCIPQRLSRLATTFACNDSPEKQSVQVRGKLFQLPEDTDGVSSFLEVSNLVGPLPIIPTTRISSEDDIYTLCEAARLETIDRKEKTFSICNATIVAVSPVLAMDRNDAFCLVDIADEELSAVVVLRGSSLRFQRGLAASKERPTTVATFYRLRKQLWRMRASGIQDCPAAAFVADASSSITWEASSPSNDESHAQGDSTVLRGTVESVHVATSGTTKKRLNYLEIRLHDDDGAGTTTVYMTHFPLSMADFLSLRPGCEVELRNLYKLGEPMIFAACLRSSLSVTRFPSTSRPDVSLSEISSFAWHERIKPNYSYLFAKRSVAKFVGRNEHLPSWFSLDDMCKSLVPKTKATTRNAFLEFLASDVVVIESADSACPHVVLPPLVGLSEIVEQSFDWLIDRLDGDMSVGWRAELHVPTDAFQKDCPAICTFGRCISVEQKHRSLFLTLSDGLYQIPVVSTPAMELRVGSAIWLGISHVYVSCVCISESHCEDVTDERKSSHTALPIRTNEDQPKLSSCCRVISSGRWVYMASVYAVAEQLYSRTSSDSPSEDNNQAIPRSTTPLSVMECLLNREEIDKRQPIESLLLRSTFKILKVKTAGYGGCTLSVSHFPEDDEDFSTTLQQVELKPTVGLDDQNPSVLRDALRSFCRQDSLSHERLSLGLVWWRMATDPKTCSLLLGGWEVGEASIHRERPNLRVVVWILGSALRLDPKRGYCRLRSVVRDLVAVTIPPTNGLGLRKSPLYFCVDKSEHVITGTLGQRMTRLGGGRYSELRLSSGVGGFPIMTLRDVLADLAKDLSTQTRCNLRPSLVRQMHSETTFLGVSYCRVQAECSKCYGALEDAGGNVVCTNGCKNEGRGIKWECSGILDDGTGQAKLYAERGAALLLLGLAESTIAHIEQGVWASKTKAIVFSKSMPPKSYLGRSVESARSMAAAYRRIHDRQWSGKLREEEVLRHMPPSTRGEYLLEWHCRYSSRPCRRLIYFVRCKPVADGVMHLMQTEIDLPLDMNIVSYSFPQIKLILVDCSQPAEFQFD